MQHLGSKYLAPRHTHPDPKGQKVKIQLFHNMVMLHNKLKGMVHRAPCKLHTPLDWVGLQDRKNSACGHVAYQFKGKEV